MLESAIEARSVKYARSFKCEAFKLSGRSAPDRLILVPGKGLFFVEFKAPGKKPRDDQKREHARLRKQGYDVFVIDDFDDFRTALNWAIDE